VSSKTFSFFIFCFSSNNILLHRELSAVYALDHTWPFRQTMSNRRGKSHRP
jgi:hypothetical protein